MSAKKQNKSSKKPANKSKQELSSVEEDILACYKKNQPVLLYGNDSTNIKELIERIKGVQCEHSPDIKTIKTGALLILEAEASEDLFPPKYIDCGDMDGREVYETLVVHSGLYPLAEGYLLIEHGDLIIDNLHCDPEKDEKDYRKLGKIIKERQIGHTPTNFNWLVAYTYDPDPLPPYFKERFEPISLDEELKEINKRLRKKALKHIGKEPKKEVEQQDEKADKIGKVILKVGNNYVKRIDTDKKVSLLPKQIKLLKYLYGKKNEHVTREDIHNHLWIGCNVNDDQITDHVSKLVEAFVKIGYKKEVVKKEIIKTVKKSSKRKGGYILHNNLVILDYD